MTAPRMTRVEALAEARKRWGAQGHISILTGDLTGLSFDSFEVGEVTENGNEWVVKGSGDSWEVAFKDADRRAK